MRVSSEPHYSFTIPSVHDDTTLDCRIYHPDALDFPSGNAAREPRWRKRGIIMAHPYAAMGGSYDDRVVGIVVEEMLKAGYIAGTFNFRGAHGSKHKGRTSWTGRPELDDYSSFAACFMQYMSLINPLPESDTVFTPDQSPARPPTRQASGSLPGASPLVILGGYSYGSLILQHLPPIPSILQRFSNPLAGSAVDEILLRAHKLADQSNLEWINLARDMEHEWRSRKHEHKTSVMMGGEETAPDQRRRSREVKRSLDTPRGLDLGHRLRSLSHRGRKVGDPTASLEQTDAKLAIPEVRYLIISPVTPPISMLAAPALGQKLWSRSTNLNTTSIGRFVSLVIYGDQDFFASAKKIRDWSDHLKAEHGPTFSSVEVAGAGHFWVEKGVEDQLRNALSWWIAETPTENPTMMMTQEAFGVSETSS